MRSIRFHANQLVALVQGLRIRPALILGTLTPYYLLTIISAFLEGLGMMLLVAAFAGGVALLASSELPPLLLLPLQTLVGDGNPSRLVALLLAIFGINLLIRFGLIFFDGYISAILRRKLQEAIFGSFLHGDWEYMRSFRVGDAVGTNTQEAIVVAKYMVSAVAAVYFLLGAVVMGGLALLTNFEISLALGAISVPLALLMRRVFSVQSRLSRQSAGLRNDFSSDVTDRFNGLLQIQVDNNFDYHLSRGLRMQPLLTGLDIQIGACQAVIGSFNLLLPFFALLGFALWLRFFGTTPNPELGLIASVGVLGMKVAGQLNGAVASIGNLSRLSGSLYPVTEALNVPSIRPRQPIPETVAGIEAASVSYAYGDLRVIDSASLLVRRNAPLVLCGRSGKGKTTLANLLAGLYFPINGEVSYIGESGKKYSSISFLARVGFVTQDIYLFRGSLRDNLTSGRSRTDQEIWHVLEQVDAADFVRQLGGLDTESAEAGRSLSGGQRRRLGIARVLLSGVDILVLDEVTAGLDQSNKAAVLGLIERLSERYVIVLVSHDPLAFKGQITFSV